MERPQRRLAGILAADVAGYSRLMAADEAGTLARFKLLRSDHLEPAIRAHGGRVVGEAGDSLLVEFGTASEAVACAVETQIKLAELNAELPEDRRMRFRMGVNLGEVIADGATIHGDGVNIAARLEKLAEPGSVIVARVVHDQIKGKVPYRFEDLGDKTLHNIAEPVRAYRVDVMALSVASGAGLPLPDKPSIAVLPFTNMSGDPEQAYFSDGLTEDIITGLSRFRNLFVIARNSSFAYRGPAVDVRRVGRELGVRYVLEGSVRKAGGQVRITAQLVDAESGAHLWAHRYDGGIEDIFALQDEVTRNIVLTLGVQLDDASLDIGRRKSLSSFDTYDLWLRAHRLSSTILDLRNLDEARRSLEAVVARDPRFARAHASLAHIHRIMSLYRAGPDRRMHLDLSLACGRAAVAADDADSFTHAALGNAYVYREEFEHAGNHFERSHVLNPNDAASLAYRAEYLLYSGDAEGAADMLHTCMRLNPRHPEWYFLIMGLIRLIQRDYAAAVMNMERCTDNTLPDTDAWRAAAHALAGHGEAAHRCAEEFVATVRTTVPGAADFTPRQCAEWFMSMIPWRRKADRDHIAEGVRLAGLLE